MVTRKTRIKKGLYARRLTPEETKTIAATPVLDGDGEIAYLRAMINRLGQIVECNGLAADSTEALSPETRSTVKLLHEALGRLQSYLRLRDALKLEEAELRAKIERGKMIARQRMHVFDYFKTKDEG